MENVKQQEYSEPNRSLIEGKDLKAENDDDDDLSDCTIEKMPNGVYKLTMHVDESFYGGLIGRKGDTKRRIENETRTQIFIPRKQIGTEKRDENVIIKATNQRNLRSACHQIKLLIRSFQKRKVTHFIAVALNCGEIHQNFLEFKKHILQLNFPGIEDQLFQSEARLHITLTICSLLDDAERNKAIELFQNSRKFLTDLCPPFDIKVDGLKIMNDDPSNVRIVYGIVDAPDLQKYANRCLESFLHAGLALDEGRRNVNMHMTLLNVNFLQKVNPNAPRTFDAREIMKRFSDFYFGTTKCDEIELCIRGNYIEEGKADEFYEILSSLKI